ncbi:MAG: FAD-dependent monooxygenase, partial [Acidobacteriota bacterium]
MTRTVGADEVVDVLVVGGGPAGLAAAIAARLRGFSVRVVERRPLPTAEALRTDDVSGLDKACGEGLMPDGLARLASWGVALDDDAGQPFGGIRYVDDDGRVAEGRFPVDAGGRGVRRTRLHAALLGRAHALGVAIASDVGTAHLDDPAAVDRLGPLAPPIVVRAGDAAWSGRWLLVADGLRSPLRAALGLARPAARTAAAGAARLGIRRHVACAPWTDCVEVHWADDAEAYVTPVADDEIGIAILWWQRPAPVDASADDAPAAGGRFE